MTDTKRYEVLNALPTYGPMYVPVTEDGKLFYSEGFVRFFKSNGDNWVANFKPGFKSFSDVFDFKNSEQLNCNFWWTRLCYATRQ